MASIHRRPGSPFWWGAFLLASGKRAFRSTKCKKRSEAIKVVMAWENAARTRATEAQIRRVFSDIHNTIHGRPLVSASVKDYAERWLVTKTGETSKSTISAYRTAVRDFLEFIGDRQHADLASVMPAEISAARDAWAAHGARPKSVNNRLKAIRVLFGQAWRDGIIVENPAAKVPTLKGDAGTRRAFTLEEIKKVLAAADGEWRGMVLAGLYTGQRMADIARLRWNQVDLVAGNISLTTAKTGRPVNVPIANPLHVWLSENAGDDATGPVFPETFGKLERGGPSPLSQAFHSILVTAGLAVARGAKSVPTGKGRRAPRPRGDVTFHSLRHTATSWLKAAGASEAIARDIIGHESAEVSRHYTHATDEDKRAAIARLPSIT